MSDPFLGEVRLMSFSFPPKGWALCNGQLLPINQNQALFSLLGTMYGGNGQTTFALPDLRGRVPMHVGGGHTQGERAGQSAHTVTASELPAHVHAFSASTTQATTGQPSASVMKSTSRGTFAWSSPQSLLTMDPSALASTGGSQPHENRQPFLTVSFCIALQGVFPSRT